MSAPSDAVARIAAAWRAADALLFDFDGVLALSEPLHRDAFNRALAPYDRRVPPAEYYVHFTSKGEGIRGQIARHAPDWDHVDPDAVKREKERVFRSFCEEGAVPLHPRAAALLARLQEDGRPWSRPFTIASNTPRAQVEAILRRAGAPVPPVVGGDGLPIKPAPDIFLRAAATLATPPPRCLVFEDTEKGLRAAAAGGIPAVLVRTPQTRAVPIPADLYLAEVDDLARLFEALALVR